MLSESVLAEQDSIFFRVRDHGVRPVEHRRFKEKEGSLPNVEAFPVFNDLDLPPGHIKKPVEPFACSLGHVDRRLWRKSHYPAYACGVIVLDMIDHHMFYLRGLNKGFYIFDGYIREVMFHGIDEGGFVIQDEVIIVAGAPWRFVAVKIPHGPVYRSNPVDIVF